uniref:Mediator complex subunit 23 n=1 Tax=Heterorhabditis bacteriophora TaxID=37862 RepID=A0A1I7WGL0_HETBA
MLTYYTSFSHCLSYLPYKNIFVTTNSFEHCSLRAMIYLREIIEPLGHNNHYYSIGLIIYTMSCFARSCYPIFSFVSVFLNLLVTYVHLYITICAFGSLKIALQHTNYGLEEICHRLMGNGSSPNVLFVINLIKTLLISHLKNTSGDLMVIENHVDGSLKETSMPVKSSLPYLFNRADILINQEFSQCLLDYVIETNSSFKSIESPSFIKMIGKINKKVKVPSVERFVNSIIADMKDQPTCKSFIPPLKIF